MALQRRKLRLHRLLPLRRISNERLGPGQLIHGRLAVQSQLKHLRDLCLDGFQTLIVPHPPGQALSQRDDKRIVHHRKRLRRDIGHIAATFRAGGHRRIHDRQERIEPVSNNANVKTAAIAVGIIRAAKWSAIQRTTYLQHGITNRLCFQPANMSASQQAIVRIHLARLGRRCGRQLERSRERDFANQLFDRPCFGDESLGQVVEQFRMRRCLAQLSEVVGRGDEAAAKHVMPDTVHDHARGQRVVRMQHRLRQFQSTGVFSRKRLGIDRLKESARHGLSRLLVIAANKKRPIPGFSLNDSWRTLWHWHLSLESAIFLHQLSDFW